ncbi:TetR/AcrR family transcriptional regulator [Plantibacter sp. YIM 135249]|uniref:TetR/AcrR family transcriptional regulator n=1 Tax=Plantibacter sp. YIM 135249 TaxID=3423918 RepID=UPI003D355A1E
MAGTVRTTMIEGATRLLATRGLQGTSFSEVLELTGAPRGSVYHHFPDGKEQLVGEAIDLAGARAIDVLDQLAGSTPEAVADRFLSLWRSVLTMSELRAGCAVLAVTIATDSPELLDRTAAVFRTWRERLTGLLVEGGVPDAEAARFAATLIAASEGAVVLARAEQSLVPFDLVAESLRAQAATLPGS